MLAALPAAAQVGAPVPLIPREPPAATPPAGGAGDAGPPRASGSVVVGQLEALDPSAVGVLQQDRGGLPFGMWHGSEMALVERLLPRLGPTTSPAVQDLSRRLLQSAALPPRGRVSGPSLLALRVERLLAIGDLDGARALAGLASAQLRDPLLRQGAADAAWLAGDTDGACVRVNAAVREDSGVDWLKASAFCQVLAGRHDGAGIAAGLLRERGVADPLFFALLAALYGDRDVRIGEVREATPLHIAMLRAAERPLPPAAIGGIGPAGLRALAEMPATPAETRLVAAERAAGFGSLPVEWLGEAYGAVSFTAEQLADARRTAEKSRDPRSNALLYQAVRAEPAPLPAAELLAVAWGHQISPQTPAAVTARLYRPEFERLQPSAEIAVLAPAAGRAALLRGDAGSARRWTEAAPGPAADRLAPLLGLADGGELGEDALRAWEVADRAAGGPPEEQADRAASLYLLLEATGRRVPDAMWLPVYEVAPAAAAPVPALRRGLGLAAENGRVAETVLFAVLLMGKDGAAAAPAAVAEAVTALRRVGLEREARAIAVEAAVAAGL